jgi:hypothetical protein
LNALVNENAKSFFFASQLPFNSHQVCACSLPSACKAR